jgi:hypothetical protein
MRHEAIRLARSYIDLICGRGAAAAVVLAKQCRKQRSTCSNLAGANLDHEEKEKKPTAARRRRKRGAKSRLPAPPPGPLPSRRRPPRGRRRGAEGEGRGGGRVKAKAAAEAWAKAVPTPPSGALRQGGEATPGQGGSRRPAGC